MGRGMARPNFLRHADAGQGIGLRLLGIGARRQGVKIHIDQAGSQEFHRGKTWP
jgi:hypothetical protein